MCVCSNDRHHGLNCVSEVLVSVWLCLGEGPFVSPNPTLPCRGPSPYHMQIWTHRGTHPDPCLLAVPSRRMYFSESWCFSVSITSRRSSQASSRRSASHMRTVLWLLFPSPGQSFSASALPWADHSLQSGRAVRSCRRLSSTPGLHH